MESILNVLNMIVLFFVAYHYTRNVYKKIKFHQDMDGDIYERGRQRGMKKRPDDTNDSFKKRVIFSGSRIIHNDPYGFKDSGSDALNFTVIK